MVISSFYVNTNRFLCGSLSNLFPLKHRDSAQVCPKSPAAHQHVSVLPPAAPPRGVPAAQLSTVLKSNVLSRLLS